MKHARLLNEKGEKTNPFVIGSSQRLTNVVKTQTDMKNAETILVRNVEISKKNHAPTNHRVHQSLKDLANLYRAEDRLDEAIVLLKRVLAMIEEINEFNREYVVDLHNDLATLHHANNQPQEAELWYQRAIAIDEDDFNNNDAGLSEARKNYAAFLRIMDRADEAATIESKLYTTQKNQTGI